MVVNDNDFFIFHGLIKVRYVDVHYDRIDNFFFIPIVKRRKKEFQ